MHITFVGFGWEQLGLAQLSAIARQHGHSTGLAFSAGLFDDRYNLKLPFLSGVFREDDDVLKEIARQRPDVLVFSPLTATYQWMLMIARRSKQALPYISTVFGGVHVSAVPEKVIARPEVDFLCVGEGDRAFIDILNMIQNPRDEPTRNVWFKGHGGTVIRGDQAPFIQDLDGLPIFDKTLWENVVSFRDIYFTMASRGCPYRCSYCFNDYYAKLGSGRYVRYRSPGHVIRELQWAKKRYRLRLIEFEDDVFTLNRFWLKELMRLYKREINLPFQCLTHPRHMNDEIASILTEAGCRYVQMGTQSMDDDYKRKVLHRSEMRHEVERAFQSMKKYGLKVKVDHMFNLPGEPYQAQEQALDVYRRYPPYRMQTFWINFFPRTSIMEYAMAREDLSLEECRGIEEGKISDDYRGNSIRGDVQALHVYKAYECLFKMLTVMPQPFAQKMSARFFVCLPSGVLSALSFVIDLVAGLAKNNPDHWAYAKHYLFHMRRVIFKK